VKTGTNNDGRGLRRGPQGVYAMTKSRRMTRRNALQLGVATAASPLVHIRTAGAQLMEWERRASI
jgi:hypothetical protein